MKIIGVAINNQIITGIQFESKNIAGQTQTFFWSPAPGELFCKWNGSGFDRLPINRLPQGKRQMLMECWRDRARIQAEAAKERRAKG
jgi:hypothetical protein